MGVSCNNPIGLDEPGKQLINCTGTLFSTNSLIGVDESTWTASSKMIFPGTTKLGIPQALKIALYVEPGTNMDFRIYDFTNSNLICLIQNVASGPPAIYSTSTFWDLPTGEAVFEIQSKLAVAGVFNTATGYSVNYEY